MYFEDISVVSGRRVNLAPVALSAWRWRALSHYSASSAPVLCLPPPPSVRPGFSSSPPACFPLVLLPHSLSLIQPLHDHRRQPGLPGHPDSEVQGYEVLHFLERTVLPSLCWLQVPLQSPTPWLFIYYSSNLPWVGLGAEEAAIQIAGPVLAVRMVTKNKKHTDLTETRVLISARQACAVFVRVL